MPRGCRVADINSKTPYEPPPESVPYLFDFETTKLLGLQDWLAAAQLAKNVREEWQARFQ